MHEVTIFQTSDLATKRVEFVQAARAGSARLRDKDGTSLVMLPEQRILFLQTLAEWSGHLLRLQELLKRDAIPSVRDLGELAWLRGFDREDLLEFADELHELLVAAMADRGVEALEEAVAAWRTTAREIEDPLRKSILSGEHSPADFVAADRPDGE